MNKRFLDKISKLKKFKYAELKDLLEKHVNALTWEDWHAEIEKYTLKELEKILITFTRGSGLRYLSEVQKYDRGLSNVLSERKYRLNRKFKYTKQNIEKLLWVNKKLMDCFEKAADEAGRIFKQFKKNKKKKGRFTDDIEVEIQITPFFLKYYKKEKCWGEYDGGIYEVLQFTLDDKVILRDSPGRCKSDSLHFSREDSWNVEGLGSRGPKHWSEENPKDIKENVFANDYICYGMHELYDHSFWSLQDIVKIQEFWAEVKVRYQHFSEKKYGI